MRVRKFFPLNIPVQNVERATRFYREVFDLPTTFGANESRQLSFHDEDIFFDIDKTDAITVEVVVRDHQETVENHLLNYYVKQAAPMTIDPDGRHVIFHLMDPEGNAIKVIANK